MSPDDNIHDESELEIHTTELRQDIETQYCAQIAVCSDDDGTPHTPK